MCNERAGFPYGQPWKFYEIDRIRLWFMFNRSIYLKFTIATTETHQWRQWGFCWTDFAHYSIDFEHIGCIERWTY